MNVAISSQFFGVVFALGTGVKILAPENVVERLKQEIDTLRKYYEGQEKTLLLFYIRLLKIHSFVV